MGGRRTIDNSVKDCGPLGFGHLHTPFSSAMGILFT